MPVVVFDGDCGFCTRAVEWAQRRSPIAAVPWQRADLNALGITSEQAQAAVWYADAGRRASGADACAAILQRSPLVGWRFTGYVLALPGVRSLARLGYRIVAANRHRLPGGTPACAPENQELPAA